MTTASVSIVVMELDTSFELTDFLSEDEMEVMEVRQDIYESYDAALEIVDIIIEPLEGEDHISGESDLLRALISWILELQEYQKWSIRQVPLRQTII